MASETALRKRALRRGYRLVKSRQRESLDNLGDFMLLDLHGNFPVAGFRYSADLAEIEEFLRDGG